MAAKPSWKTTLVLWLAALGAQAGCGGRQPLDVGDGGSAGQGAGTSGGGGGGAGGFGGAGGTATCQDLDETTCNSRSDDCQSLFCADCKGGQAFAVCGGPGDRINCEPCPPPPPCDALDQSSCAGRPDCHSSYCPNCNGGQTFALCAASNEAAACPGTTCPQSSCTSVPDEATCGARGDCHGLYCPDCKGSRTYLGCGGFDAVVDCGGCPPALGPCANATSLLACDGRTDCHPVFGDLGGCNCTAPGCCIGFERCADGAQANCAGAPACKIVAPSCGPQYVVSHNAMCYDGCVLPSECAP